MLAMKSALKSIIENRWIKIIVALALFFSAGAEVFDNLEELNVGAHHGVLLYSILNIFKTLPDFFEGSEILSS